MHSTGRLGLNIPDAGDSVQSYPAAASQAFGVLDAALLFGRNTLAKRPAASSVPNGYAFQCTDAPIIFLSDGATWHYIPVDQAVSPIGAVQNWAGSGDPVDADGTTRWLVCDGRAISRSLYPALFSAIGTAWGAGDGSTTFNIPDMRGRVAVGAGAGSGLTARTNGQRGGEETHTLGTNELASHSHALSDPGHSHGVSDPGHAHGVYDPGHTHSCNNATADGLGRHAPVAAAGSGAWGMNTSAFSSGLFYPYNAGNTQDSGLVHNHSINGAGTGISVNGAGTGVSVNGAGTGVSVNSSGAGITAQNAGSGAAHNNMQPYAVVNHIIRAL